MIPPTEPPGQGRGHAFKDPPEGAGREPEGWDWGWDFLGKHGGGKDVCVMSDGLHAEEDRKWRPKMCVCWGGGERTAGAGG